MAENLIGRPTLSGVMLESVDYTNMGIGLTDRIFLIGHADGLELGDPYQVGSLKEALRVIGTNPDSPMVQGLLETYYAGARDIWIIAAAPTSEYVADLEERLVANPEWGGKNFYEQYYDRLQYTLDLLQGYEVPQFIVPLHAPLWYEGGDVDFVTLLSDHCLNAFSDTGSVRVAVMGTAVQVWNGEVVNALVEDPRWAATDAGGKFVLPVVGSGLFNIQEMPITHQGPLNTVVAAQAAQVALNRGLTNHKLPQVTTTNFSDFTSTQLEKICNAKLNPVTRSTRGKRGRAFETVLLTDNMLAANGSDYWSFGQVKLIMTVIEDLRSFGRRNLGTVGFPIFKEQVNQYLLDLSLQNVIRNFDVSFTRNQPTETERFSETITVDVLLQPYFGVRTLTFQAQVGPGV